MLVPAGGGVHGVSGHDDQVPRATPLWRGIGQRRRERHEVLGWRREGRDAAQVEGDEDDAAERGEAHHHRDAPWEALPAHHVHALAARAPAASALSATRLAPSGTLRGEESSEPPVEPERRGPVVGTRLLVPNLRPLRTRRAFLGAQLRGG